MAGSSPDWMVVAVSPGLAHRLAHNPPDQARGELRGWSDVIGGATDRWGGLGDGLWARMDDGSSAVELGLLLARLSAAVGVDYGEMADGLRGPPIGRPMMAALGLARSIRQGEVLMPRHLLDGVVLPRGVGHFAAPEELDGGSGTLAFVKDYRAEH